MMMYDQLAGWADGHVARADPAVVSSRRIPESMKVLLVEVGVPTGEGKRSRGRRGSQLGADRLPVLAPVRLAVDGRPVIGGVQTWSRGCLLTSETDAQ